MPPSSATSIASVAIGPAKLRCQCLYWGGAVRKSTITVLAIFQLLVECLIKVHYTTSYAQEQYYTASMVNGFCHSSTIESPRNFMTLLSHFRCVFLQRYPDLWAPRGLLLG